MNGTNSKTISYAPGQLAFPQPFELGWSRYFYPASLFLAAAATLFFIILLKSKTTVDYSFEPVLFIYSIFVTSFQLSRVATATFYKKTLHKVMQSEAVSDSMAIADYWEPEVTFVIPCKNEEKDIAHTVKRCFEADYPKDKLQVIVINDGSTDNTYAVLKDLQNELKGLEIIHFEKNRGKRQAMAEGMRQAKGEIIVQLDSDSYIEPSTFRNLIYPFWRSDIGAVCAHADPQNADKNILTRMQAAYYFMSFRILKAAESTFLSVFCCSGCASAYRKSAVFAIIDEWENEKFLGLPVTWGDDRALTSWVLKQGYKTLYLDPAYVQAYTIIPEKFKQLIKQQSRWKKSWIANAFITGRFIWKKQPFVSLFYFFPLIAISFLTPLMAVRALIYIPIRYGIFPFYHIFGILLITALITVFYRYVAPKNKYWPYLFLWSLLNLFVLSFLMIWAALRIQNRGWGTR